MGSLRDVLWVVLAGCTATEVVAPPSAGPGGAGTNESFDPPPAGPAMRLEQTDDSTIAKSLSLACSDGLGTLENSWYRVFSLHDEGIDGAFTVNRVNFAVQTAVGKQRVQVSIGTYAGAAGAEALDPTKLDVLAMTTVNVPPTSTGEMLQANFAGVEVPAGSNLVVEVHSAGRGTNTDGIYFYLGATQATESIPGYLAAPTCNTPSPTMTSALGHLQTHLILAVSGTR